MSEKFGEVIYYSERGMVNAICYSIQQYKSAGFHFIKKIKNTKGEQIFEEEKLKDIKSIQVFNEFSFGQFGDPDFILKINFENESKLLFIEAKVGTYANSAKDTDCINGSYENNASRINFQLRLKKRFVDALKNSKDDKKIEDKIEKDVRCLKKAALVDYIRNVMFINVDKEDGIYYIAMTSDEGNPFDKNKLPFANGERELNNLGYITYNSFYGESKSNPNNKNREECVLYGNTYKMFKTAFELSKNKFVKDEENEEL